MSFDRLTRREFITLLGGATAAWPTVSRAQQPKVPVIGFLSGSSPEMGAARVAAFRRGLVEAGVIDGQNVTVEYHWLDSHYDQLPALIADFVRRRVAVIATPGIPDVAAAVKATPATIPIVFGISEDPVKLGLVASLARPGGNATGVNFFTSELVAKRLALLHELVPGAVRLAALINPASGNADSNLQDLMEAAAVLGLQIEVLKAGTRAEIEAAFASLAHMPADALFIGGGAFFDSRRVQLVILATRLGIPTFSSTREGVEAGLLISYGTDILDMYRQVAVYAGRILKGAKPADLPVVQAVKFELVINLQTARALGIEVQPSLLATADEVIE
jgi:putative tryptophan/tyrosine transport system substrate-binding protein